MEKQILEKFNSIQFDKKYGQEVQITRENLEYYLGPKIPSYKRNVGRFGRHLIKLSNQTGEKYNSKILEILKKLNEWEYSLGYRTEIFTLQEHKLKGSTADIDKIKGEINPYIPIALQKEKPILLEEIQRARKLSKYTLADLIYYKICEEKNIKEILKLERLDVFLEPLNKKGETIRDPRPLNDKLKIIINYKKSKDFPFIRND